MQASNDLSRFERLQTQSIGRLSSGLRVNSASDDAASLSISTGMRMKISGLGKVEQNLLTYQESGKMFESVGAIVTTLAGRMRDLATQAMNGDLTSTDRGYLDTEYQALMAEWDRTQDSILLDPIMTQGKYGSIHFSDNAMHSVLGIDGSSASYNEVTSNGVNFSSGDVNVNGSSITSTQSASSALTDLSVALTTIGSSRATMGAYINRLEVAVESVRSQRVNLQAGESRIRDLDYAEETAQLARTQVMRQMSASVLAQSNFVPQLALQLLRG